MLALEGLRARIWVNIFCYLKNKKDMIKIDHTQIKGLSLNINFIL